MESIRGGSTNEKILAIRQAEEIVKKRFADLKPPTKLEQIKENLLSPGKEFISQLSVFDVVAFTVPTVAVYLFLSQLEPFKDHVMTKTAISALMGYSVYRTILDAADKILTILYLS